MNKKILILLATFVSLMSIMVISIWGTLPENNNLPPIDAIDILDYDELNSDNDKLIDVTNLVTETNNSHIIKFNVTPVLSNDSKLIVQLSEPLISYQLSVLNGEIYVYYDIISIQLKKSLTVTIIDQNTQVSDSVTLWFKPSDVVIIPD